MSMKRLLIRGLYVSVLIASALAVYGFSLLLDTQELAYEATTSRNTTDAGTQPFPVSVDPETQTIDSNDLLNTEVVDTLALDIRPDTLLEKFIAQFERKSWYQSLASPVSRIIVIWPGERKEEIVSYIGATLGWNSEVRAQFSQHITSTDPALSDGKFYPGRYVAHKEATPKEVADLINAKFNTDILERYTPEVESKVPLSDALIIASLLEREASDFENMREISGVIWNRLFIDMPLQLDATLQYVRGSKQSEKDWWPVPKPADKYLSSPYNTYRNAGLPPGPIANPSAASVLAALNPYPTDCYFYFHDKNAGYHCSVTYEEHVQKLKKFYGRGS
jgi:cell division protein YceG involved in septum cleavage